MKTNFITIKTFIDDLKNYTTNCDLNNLNNKEKKFILFCTKILKNPQQANIDAKEFNKKSKKIIANLFDNKKYNFFRKLTFGINRRVISEVNFSDVKEKKFIELMKDLEKSKRAFPDKRIDFADFLYEHGWADSLENLNFKEINVFLKTVSKAKTPPYWGTNIFKNVDFKNIEFQNCDLEYLNFTGSHFENCTFKNCNLNHAVLTNANFNSVKFSNVYLKDSEFEESIFNEVEFDESDLKYSNFSNCRLNSVNFHTCKMEGTNFFESTVISSKLINCNLVNCLLFEAKEVFKIQGGVSHKLTKPVIALPWDPEKPGIMATKTFISLKQSGALPCRYNYNPYFSNTDKLNAQVKKQIAYFSEHPDEIMLSIPAAILNKSMENEESRKNNFEISQLIQQTAKLVNNTDGILLPGGMDIEPEFYGSEKDLKTLTAPDYRRSIIEFALLREARSKGIPLMGICRGSQISNVFFGGTLKQHLAGHQDTFQKLTALGNKKDQAAGTIKSVTQEGIEGYSSHHQAIAKIGQNLEKILTHTRKIRIKTSNNKIFTQTTVKALEGIQGAPIILTQFHPEISDDILPSKTKLHSTDDINKSRKLFSTFIEAAENRKRKRRLKSEILNFSWGKKEIKEAKEVLPPIERFPEEIFSSSPKSERLETLFNTFKWIVSPLFKLKRKLNNFLKPVKTSLTTTKIDEFHLIKGKEGISPSQRAWYLNLALLRSAYNDTNDPVIKNKILFLINNYLDKSAPLRSEATKKLLKKFDENYQAHPQSNFFYHRIEYLKKLNLSRSFDKKFALSDESPLILTETTEFAHLLPLFFKVIDENDKSNWANSFVKILTEHFSSDPLKALKKPLEFKMLIDTTSLFKDSIRTNGSLEKEKEFNTELGNFKEEIAAAIDQATKILISRNPTLNQNKKLESSLQKFMQDNLVFINRVDVNENLGGIKILPIYLKVNKLIQSNYGKIKEFIDHTGIALGGVNARRYLTKAYELRADIRYGVEGDNALYFKTPADICETALFKRLSGKFSDSKLMEDNPQTAIMGRSAIALVQGLMSKIDAGTWSTINADKATKKIVQSSLYQISQHLGMAELHMNNFAKFALDIELLHAELANVLEFVHPFKDSEFQKIYLDALSNVIPNDIKEYAQAGLGKTAVNLFAGINAALYKQKPNITRCFAKNLYYEEASVLGDNYKLENLLADKTIKEVDLYACQTNPNISIDKNDHHYEKTDIAGDIKKILVSKPDTKHMTVAVDCTIEVLNSSTVRELLDEFQEEIKSGKLNFVFFHSGQKFDMLGMDNYYGAPFFTINNGSDYWKPFQSLYNDKVHQADTLSHQWFSLSHLFAADLIDDYRKTIFENTRSLLKQIPRRLIPSGSLKQKLWVGTFDPKIDPCFVDIKIFDSMLKRKGEMTELFYRICEKHGINAYKRASFGFYHPCITIISGHDENCSNLRLTLGLDPKDNAAILEFINEIAKW